MHLSDDSPKILPKPNGSLAVQTVPSLTLPDSTEASADGMMFLCRCGKSENKPYCDGSHRDAGFSSEPSDDAMRGRLFAYEGPEITVQYNPRVCSHAAVCATRLKPVFDPSQKPWIQPDQGSVDAIRDVVRACPSGALSIKGEHGATVHLSGDAPKTFVQKDGPYHVENVELEDASWADGAGPQKYVLCRCGLSKTKLFCDGTHGSEGWRDDG